MSADGDGPMDHQRLPKTLPERAGPALRAPTAAEREAVAAARALIAERQAEGRHHVAASLIADDGRLFTFLNLESVLGQAARCAEPAALSAAFSHAEPPAALVFMEDVGRHNAVDKIAGWMFREGVGGGDKMLYTTGRLTSEMVIKTALMGIPVLASRSGFTAWGVDLARQVNLTLIGRLRGRRFHCVAGPERLVFDSDPQAVPEEDGKHRRKGATA